jgi:hypothetical protein
VDFERADDLLSPGYLPFESGHMELGGGKRLVAALTRMPGCRAKMVDWWFSWLGGIEWYKLWHPRDHLFSDWENRIDGRYIGASHLVHEYLAGPSGPVYKLRINFQPPESFFDAERYRAAKVLAICAKIGDLEHPVNFGRMCHFVRDTDYGCEMRSRFWLGLIESRDPGVTFSHAQVAAIRQDNVTEDLARRLHQHAVEEMGYLAEILPVLYRRVTGDDTF